MLLAVTLLAAIVMAAPLLEHRYLLALGLGHDFGSDGQAIGRLQARTLAGEQDVAQRDAVARVAVELLDDDLVSLGNAILLAARAHDCEHWLSSLLCKFRSPRVRAQKTPADGARESEAPMAAVLCCQPPED